LAKRTIRDLTLQGRPVFIRVDFNVPLKGGVIGDDTRIRETLPTLTYALEAGASRVVLASHLGRPKGKPNPDMSLRPVAARTGELLGVPVAFAEDCVGAAANDAVAAVPAGGVILLENLRFHPEEEKNDAGFAEQLAGHAEVYVNRFMREAGAGLLMDKELKYLGEALENPRRPFVAILGGAKVSDKIEVIENLIPRVDTLLIGGAMAYTFLQAQGKPTGRSLVEPDKVGEARDIMERSARRGLPLLLPADHVVAEKVEAGVATATLSVDDAAIGERMGLDIGPASVREFTGAIARAETVVWNGPMGVFEIDAFARGTLEVGRAVADVKGTTIVGGGDSIAAVKKAGVADRITHISTGGGASLEFLGGRTLPGVAVLPDA
jgi:phosphoglycerate kinase